MQHLFIQFAQKIVADHLVTMPLVGHTIRIQKLQHMRAELEELKSSWEAMSGERVTLPQFQEIMGITLN